MASHILQAFFKGVTLFRPKVKPKEPQIEALVFLISFELRVNGTLSHNDVFAE